MKAECKNCKKEFSYSPSQKRGHFCSNNCQGEYMNEQNVVSGTASFKSIRRYVLKHWTYQCSECNISEWMKRRLTLQLDHIDGDKSNNSLSNLRWLCPNCHSQTKTWGVQNVSEEGKKRLATKKRK